MNWEHDCFERPPRHYPASRGPSRSRKIEGPLLAGYHDMRSQVLRTDPRAHRLADRS